MLLIDKSKELVSLQSWVCDLHSRAWVSKFAGCVSSTIHYSLFLDGLFHMKGSRRLSLQGLRSSVARVNRLDLNVVKTRKRMFIFSMLLSY